MKSNKAREAFHDQVQTAYDQVSAKEFELLRGSFLAPISHADVSAIDMMESAIEYWSSWLQVDRIFVCDMKDGAIVAGWNKGKNIAKLQDWHPSYMPLEDDITLQLALESDQLIAAPVDGQGADLAFSMYLDDTTHWLVVFDETDVARIFSEGDMARIRLVRDMITLKHQIRMSEQSHRD